LQIKSEARRPVCYFPCPQEGIIGPCQFAGDFMAVSLEAFVKHLTDSGIIAPGQLENFIPPKAQPKDAQELARQLVQNKHLTKFQAR